MSLPAGEMRWRVQVQQKLQATDPDYGGPAGDATWQNVGTPVWARRTNNLRAAAEAVASGGLMAPVQVRFDMRPRAITPDMRMIGVGGDHDGVIYDIQNVGTSNDRSEMAVLVIAGQSNG